MQMLQIKANNLIQQVRLAIKIQIEKKYKKWSLVKTYNLSNLVRKHKQLKWAEDMMTTNINQYKNNKNLEV